MDHETSHTAWSDQEVAVVVRCYLDMLTLELAGQRYRKSTYREQVLAQLFGQRSAGAVEFKYCNISAVMQLLQYPSIQGYKPRNNFQKSLLQEVEQQVMRHPHLAATVQAAVTLPAHTLPHPAFDHAWQAAPEATHQVSETNAAYAVRSPARRDYLAQEARNQALGLAGEEFVVGYERWKLQRHGLPGLADRVEHVAVTLGDGLGFDVRSFDLDGQECWIEVKTTNFAKNTPFYVTHNELATSQAEAEKFQLYRVFEFRRQPKFFALPGNIASHCTLDPVTYRASL